MNTEVGAVLAEIRAASGLTQRELAERMGANQTRVSRIESGEADGDDVAAFLDAIDTPQARHVRELLHIEWSHMARPSLKHPNLETLAKIEHALVRVQDFLADVHLPAVLAGQAELLRKRLEENARYLMRLDHEIVYVGEIGVGKTTTACRQSGLVLDEAVPADLKGMLLDTGGGRTTLCDVRVRAGEKFALIVEPVSDEEVYKLVGEICRSVREKLDGESTSSSAEFKPAEEVERALRNMAGLPRPSRPRKGPAPPDPAADLAQRFTTHDEFAAEFAARLCLWRRTKRVTEFDGIDPKEGRQWLRSTFTAINNGRNDDFSLPANITVTVPFELVPSTRLSIQVVDTRGVDGSAVRSDIIAHLKDDRAVTLLCSKWGSAPDPSIQELLTHVCETNADPLLLNRVAVVALARGGDALSMRHDSGEGAQDVEEGYDIKLGHIEDALQKIGLRGIDASAFDASADDPAGLTAFILDKLGAIRKAQADAAEATINAVDEMLSNREQAQALAAMSTVSGNLMRFAERSQQLKGARRPAHKRLLNAVKTLHPRTVWAATRRAGEFWNFDVFQYLGDGAAAEAKVRSSTTIAGLLAIIESDQGNPELASAHGFLAQIAANVAQWEADFVNAARHHAKAVYRGPLSRATDLWDRCEADYGTSVGGYRDGVAHELEEWFDNSGELREELERRIGRAWETSVIEPLLQVAGSTANRVEN
ncbi:helix-turn-helix domain-containing protein [Burkholderia pseudomallei]|uniref:helix-turn-helix transcriptional regulator n=1 Tax=Burkholderia pseudomallei TaxID=28450 RepID=UPI000F4E44E7|nr:helix-turn-helix transcriptional regulator [Burkholderia pseudomallei]RPE22989.1 XRE family transcriptional regulator [Burkholderia pseudomallei]RQS98988.1 XRE family transcriptional regulator [Burkholderia pseudomallei]RSK71166.1 helix-turn-helix domain-containing protein [Burkholderia pseudomallei]